MPLHGTLIRCPKCIAPLKGQRLDPDHNTCQVCGHFFTAAAAIIEDYPTTRRKNRP